MRRSSIMALWVVVLASVWACASHAGPPASKLVVLMITDNTDHQHTGPSSIAVGVTRNAELMEGFFNQVASGTGMNVVMQQIAGKAPPNDPFNCENAIATIKALPIDEGDAVMVYYSGHGINIGTDNPELSHARLSALAPPEFSKGPLTRFPFIACGTQLQQNAPNLDMIASWLAVKRPRLTIVMADACNSYLRLTGPPAEQYYATNAPLGIEERRLRSLFLEASGTVLMTGSQPGHYSWYYNDKRATTGGVFTLRFLEIMKKLPIDKPVTWSQVGDSFGSMKVNVGPGTTDLQTPLMHIGPAFDTANLSRQDVAVQVAATDAAQVLSIPGSALRTPETSPQGRTRVDDQQTAPGIPVGTNPGPLPVPTQPERRPGEIRLDRGVGLGAVDRSRR